MRQDIGEAVQVITFSTISGAAIYYLVRRLESMQQNKLNEYYSDLRTEYEVQDAAIKYSLENLFNVVLPKHFTEFNPQLSIRQDLERLGEEEKVRDVLKKLANKVDINDVKSLKGAINDLSNANDKEIITEWLNVVVAKNQFLYEVVKVKYDMNKFYSLIDSAPWYIRILESSEHLSKYLSDSKVYLKYVSNVIEIEHDKYHKAMDQYINTKKTACFEQVANYQKSVLECRSNSAVNEEMESRCNILAIKAENGKAQCEYIFNNLAPELVSDSLGTEL